MLTLRSHVIRRPAYIDYPEEESIFEKFNFFLQMHKYNLDLNLQQLGGHEENRILDKHVRHIVCIFFCAAFLPVIFPLLREFDRSIVPRTFVAISLFTATLPTVVLYAQRIQNHQGVSAQILRQVSVSFLVLATAELFVGMVCSYYGTPPGDPETGFIYILCGCYVFSSVIYFLISLED